MTYTTQPFTNFTPPIGMVPTFLFLLVVLEKTSVTDAWIKAPTYFLRSWFFFLAFWHFSVKNIWNIKTGIKIWARHLKNQNRIVNVSEKHREEAPVSLLSGWCFTCHYEFVWRFDQATYYDDVDYSSTLKLIVGSLIMPWWVFLIEFWD